LRNLILPFAKEATIIPAPCNKPVCSTPESRDIINYAPLHFTALQGGTGRRKARNLGHMSTPP